MIPSDPGITDSCPVFRSSIRKTGVLFASDGLHELRNGEGVEFCTTQMAEVWAQCERKSAAESVDFIFDHQMAFSAGIAPHDDITAVVLKVLA
jgi:serine phosphatase RsbU (regulator of sigma subunit)